MSTEIQAGLIIIIALPSLCALGALFTEYGDRIIDPVIMPISRFLVRRIENLFDVRIIDRTQYERLIGIR